MKPFSRILSALWNRSPREHLARWRPPAADCQPGPPTWCLSTGRVGTQTLAALGELAAGTRAVHEPAPHLFGLGQIAFQWCGEQAPRNPAARDALRAGVEACRPEAELAGRRYLETSPQVTFVAPFLLELYPESRFLHVVRHPREVIRSGMRRRWYDGHPYDRWRIQPRPGSEAAARWEHWSAFEKNLWNWQATNEWIADFLDTVPADRWLRLPSDRLFEGDPVALAALFDFLQAPLPTAAARQAVLGQVLNAQKTGSFPASGDWSAAQGEAVDSIAGPLWQRLNSLAGATQAP